MAGWDWTLLAQAEREKLIRILPVSAIDNVLVIDAKTVIAYKSASLCKEEVYRYSITVDMIVRAVCIVNEVMWDYDKYTRLVARLIKENDDDPVGRITIAEIHGSNVGLSNNLCEEVTNTPIVQAVQFLFDIIHPKKT